MGRMDEEHIDQQEREDRDESNENLHYAIVSAIMEAKRLGLHDVHVKILCYSTGIDLSMIG